MQRFYNNLFGDAPEIHLKDPKDPRKFLAGSKITVDELRERNTRQDCWMAINRNVYDLTPFVNEHPGGPHILLCAAGKDVSAVFSASHGPLERAKLRKYLVGELVGTEAPMFPEPDAFHLEVKRRVNDYFLKNNLDRKHSLAGITHHLLVILALVTLTWLQWNPIVCNSRLLFCGVAFLYGLAQMQASVTIVHDGSHGSLTRSPTLWRAMTCAHDFINGCSSTVWMYQHVISHHAFTNVDHVDVDIETDLKDFRRFKSRQSWYWFYKLQAIYCPLLYMLLATSLRIQDYTRAFWNPFWGTVLVNRMETVDLLVFHAGKTFFAMHRIVLPLLFAPCSTLSVILAFLISDFTVSFSFGLISQASHVSQGASMIKSDDEGKIGEDWMRHQIASSVDYAHDSWWTRKFTGGLNYQVAHHLFPNVAQEYYPEIAPIIMRACEEYGVKYNVKETMWDAIGGHLGLLHQMGSPPDTDHY